MDEATKAPNDDEGESLTPKSLKIANPPEILIMILGRYCSGRRKPPLLRKTYWL